MASSAASPLQACSRCALISLNRLLVSLACRLEDCPALTPPQLWLYGSDDRPCHLHSSDQGKDMRESSCLDHSQLSCVLRQVVPGQTSENFRRHPLPNLARASFSLLYTDTDQSVRTLDLTCRSQQEFELWYWGLHVSPSKTPLMSACDLKDSRALANQVKVDWLTCKHAI